MGVKIEISCDSCGLAKTLDSLPSYNDELDREFPLMQGIGGSSTQRLCKECSSLFDNEMKELREKYQLLMIDERIKIIEKYSKQKESQCQNQKK
jgi:hypothetical protein